MTKENIIQAVCEVCEIMPEDLQKRSRKEPLPTARALITHYLYRELGMFPRDIAPYIGYPIYCRTSVYHYTPRGRTVIEEQSPYDKCLREKKERVESIINAKESH